MSKRSTKLAMRLAIGRALKQRRTAMGVSQAEIGARCRATQALIARYELGKAAPSMGMLAELGAALNVPAWELLRDAWWLQEPEGWSLDRHAWEADPRNFDQTWEGG